MYDVIVVGLGAMGSAAASQMAARGQRVLGLEQFDFAHDRGSSHGASRVIRLAYFEHPSYVPLLLRAYELWTQLERDTNRSLLTLTGGLMVGRLESAVVRGSLHSAETHGLPHELLGSAEIRRRFPPLTPADDDVAFYERRAGVLRAEACVQAFQERATIHGADLRSRERVLGWLAKPDEGGVVVQTTQETFEARHLVLTPGAWAPAMFDLPEVPLTIERQALFWFAPVGGVSIFAPGRFPIYIWDVGNATQFYGFPSMVGPPFGVKVAFFRSNDGNNSVSPDAVNRTVAPEAVATMRGVLARRLPSVATGALVQTVTCLYTLTPDHHFVVGRHPIHSQVTIASPCSGHGFKFASVIGEIIADLAIAGTTHHDISLFAPARFGRSA
ncbi:MAG: N-methyl-L-tryptophan oxidase [Vicinamibacterales bacterium]